MTCSVCGLSKEHYIHRPGMVSSAVSTDKGFFDPHQFFDQPNPIPTQHAVDPIAFEATKTEDPSIVPKDVLTLARAFKEHDEFEDRKLLNIGHGHVYPRADGTKSRCGGPGLCGECSKDYVKRFGLTMTKNTTLLDASVKAAIMTRVEKDLKFFTDAMRYKLEKNAHKGRWENMDLAATLQRLRKEVTELEEAIDRRNNVEIIMEAADVANFAMIAAVMATERATARES